jgi:hypothetical protein
MRPESIPNLQLPVNTTSPVPQSPAALLVLASAENKPKGFARQVEEDPYLTRHPFVDSRLVRASLGERTVMGVGGRDTLPPPLTRGSPVRQRGNSPWEPSGGISPSNGQAR